MQPFKPKQIFLTTALATAMASSFSQDLPGKFEGVSIDAKLIGGQQYENLYSRIPEWEAATGATVNIISKKNHFELDREIKSDIAVGLTDWCVGSNHSSFAPQYTNLYVDLRDYIPAEEINAFVAGNIASATLKDKLVMLPRAQFDVSALYYQKDLYEDEALAAAFEATYGYPLGVPETWDQVKDQAVFFADSPDFFGTQYAGKDEAINGRFYEMLVANGGQYLDSEGRPAFNSEAGVEALQWFVDLYQAKAVPVGVPNYLWDDLGQGFASGTVAINLDWPGWAGFFNDPESSQVAGNVGIAPAPVGSAGKRTGWSGFHGFSVTENCDNPEAAASLVWFLTNEESQKLESAPGPLPSRTAVWEYVIEQAANDDYRSDVLKAFQTTAETSFAVPQTSAWIEISNAVFPELQAAILGDKTAQEALDDAAEEATYILEDAGEI